MYERFTDDARTLMQLAHREAARLNCEYVATEHILLGLIRLGKGLGFDILVNLGSDLDRLRAEAETETEAGQMKDTQRELPATPLATQAIEYAIQVARLYGHDYVGTEHLLLGLLRVHKGAAARILNSSGVTEDEVISAVLDPLGVGEAADPLFAIVWDPEVISESEYAELVAALGNLVRAEGGQGIERIRSRGYGVPCEAGVPR